MRHYVPIGEVSTKTPNIPRMLYSWFINTKGILFSIMKSNVDPMLSDTLTAALESQCTQATEHSIDKNFDNAGSILSEWTVSNNDCVLTNYLNQTLVDIEDELLYISFADNSLSWGSFTFQPWLNTRPTHLILLKKWILQTTSA